MSTEKRTARFRIKKLEERVAPKLTCRLIDVGYYECVTYCYSPRGKLMRVVPRPGFYC